MIIVISGVPGSGKTLFALDYVLENFENRNIYYNHIPGLQLPWSDFTDPKSWTQLPAGSVIVIDEAHQVFEKTDGKTTPPAHIAKLDEHRHHGYDLVLITQHPQDLNTYVRNRIGKFLLLERAVHSPEKCTVYEWPRYESHFNIPQVREKASIYTFKYPTELYDKYQSATLHTVERKIPKGLKQLFVYGIICAMLLPVIAYAIYTKISGISEDEKQVNTEVTNTRRIRSVIQEETSQTTKKTSSGVDYYADYMPRIPGIPGTAPIFDEINKPKTAPTLQCIASETRCQCYTQQATRTDTPLELCRAIVQQGYFDVTRSF